MSSISAYPVGATNVTTYWLTINPSTGLIDAAGVAYDATNLRLAYVLPLAAAVTAVTGGGTAPASLAADTTAHTDWGFRSLGYGIHRVDWPDAAFASGAAVALSVSHPTLLFVPIATIDLVGADPRSTDPVDSNVVEWDGTTVPTPATAGHPIVTVKVGAGTGELNVASGKVPATIAAGDLAPDTAAEIASAVNDDAIARLDGMTASDTEMEVDGTPFDITRDADGFVTSMALQP